jgi:hypothetical protein
MARDAEGRGSRADPEPAEEMSRKLQEILKGIGESD